MILTLIAVVVLPVHVPAWLATVAYALVCGPGAVHAMDDAEDQATALWQDRRPGTAAKVDAKPTVAA